MAIGKTLCGCGGPMHRGSVRCARCTIDSSLGAPTAPTSTVDGDREKRRASTEVAVLRSKYEEALKTIERQERELRATNVLAQGVDTFEIKPLYGSGTSEATAVILASDWHCDEIVGPELGGLNVFNPDIATQRATKFFQSSARLLKLLQQDVKISTVVLALLGDYITNDIHDENKDTSAMLPMHAITFAQNLLVSGIEFLLAHTNVKLLIPCHSGNHARTTKTTHFSAENGHSLEYLMYLHMATYFRAEPRITFIIPDGYHSYLDVYATTIRFHHGHAVKYGGGVGGLFIPAFKSVSQWNRARHADLDAFGHFHQSKDGGSFLCNGSLIGYNGYALSIKADFEPPRQTLFLVDKKRSRTCTWPIIL